MREFLVCSVAGVLACGCSGGTVGAGLRITIVFDSSSQSNCVIAGVRKVGADNIVDSMKGVRRPADGSSVVVGVAQSDRTRGRVIPYVRGFKSSTCEPSTAVEEAISNTSFDLDEDGVLHQVTLTLGAPQPDGGVGGGGGGGGSATGGGSGGGGSATGGGEGGGSATGGGSGGGSATGGGSGGGSATGGGSGGGSATGGGSGADSATGGGS